MAESKHFAIIVAGIDEEYQNSVINGIIECAKQYDANISCFTAFGGVLSSSKYDVGEYNIYNLVNYKQFDGVVLMTNTICDPGEKKKIISAVKKSGIPAIFLDCDDDPSFFNIRIDNSTAMREIIQHVVDEHQAKTVNFISGPLSNPEAQARYEAFLHVMAENRLIADARRVYFGEFRPQDGERAVRELLASGLPMPDAIISANDAMALAAIRTLEKAGYRVPEDVIVTGFDDTYNARHYYPALTTVSRPLHEMGYQACEILYRAASGDTPLKTIKLSSRPVYTESCGCKAKKPEDINAFKKTASKTIDGCRSDISLINRITSQLAETESAEEMIQILSHFIECLDCGQCSLCMCAEWNNVYSSGYTADDFQVRGYTKTMSAPLIWRNGEIHSVDTFISSEMFPDPLPGGGHVHYFLPLHFRDRCLGYMIISDSDFPPKSMLCHTLLMNISNSIENIRKLLHLNNVISELDRLYVIDPLCGIYNRNGFIREADTLYKRCAEKEECLLISFIDMDGLKLVNDNYGHKEGDFALQRLATVIKDCCGPNQICARFGGDEFIILGASCTEDDAMALERLFQKRLEDINHILHKPYELGASIGTYVEKVKDDVPLFNMIKIADEMMYERKKKKKTSRYLRNT